MSISPYFLDDSVQLEVNLQDLDSFPDDLSDLNSSHSEQEPHYSPISASPTHSDISSEAPLSPFSKVKFFYNIPKFQHSPEVSQFRETAQRSPICIKHHSVLCKVCSQSSILPVPPNINSPQGSKSTSHLSPNPTDANTLTTTESRPQCIFGRSHCTSQSSPGKTPKNNLKSHCSLPVCIDCQNCTCNTLHSKHFILNCPDNNINNSEFCLLTPFPPLSLPIPEAIQSPVPIKSPVHNSPLNTPELLNTPSPENPPSLFITTPLSQPIPSLLDIVVHPTPEVVKQYGWSGRPRSRRKCEQQRYSWSKLYSRGRRSQIGQPRRWLRR